MHSGGENPPDIRRHIRCRVRGAALRYGASSGVAGARVQTECEVTCVP
ncbi:hypothetical protein [Azospirillum endophyticum]